MTTDKNTIRSYNNYAEMWAKEQRSGQNSAHEFLEKPTMYSKLPNLKNKSVLCVGCGTGEECNYIKSLGAKRVVGIDISKGLINYAKKSYPKIEFYVVNMEKLNFPKASFDFVYSSLALHYIKDWTKTLKNIYGVLKRGGIFLFSTHHPLKWGGETIRKKYKKFFLIGYVKYYDGKKYKFYGDYLNSRKIKDTWFRDFKVAFYHKPFCEIMKNILDSGFEIIDFLEPKAIKAAKNKDNFFWKCHQKFPLFMIFELRKK